MNLDKLSLGEKLLAASGLLLFLLSFLDFWIKAEAGEFTVRGNAWDGYGIALKIALLCGLAAAALVGARASGANLTLPWSNVYRALAGVALALTLLTFVVGPEEAGFGVEISRGIALFIGVLLTVLMAAGAFMHAEAPGTTTTTSPGATPA